MYNPSFNRVDDPAVIADLVERARFGHLVSVSEGGFEVTGLPLLVDRSDEGAVVSLRGHLARANGHRRVLDGAEVVVILPLTDGYVSPSRYASKAVDGRVVPTWNYEVVHVHGRARVLDDAAWVRALVGELTDHHESSHAAASGLEAWEVGDAPDEFIERQVRAIVGVEIEVTRVDAKRKLSQNRSDVDRLGVIAGLDASTVGSDLDLAASMRATDGWASE